MTRSFSHTVCGHVDGQSRAPSQSVDNGFRSQSNNYEPDCSTFLSPAMLKVSAFPKRPAKAARQLPSSSCRTPQPKRGKDSRGRSVKARKQPAKRTPSSTPKASKQKKASRLQLLRPQPRKKHQGEQGARKIFSKFAVSWRNSASEVSPDGTRVSWLAEKKTDPWGVGCVCCAWLANQPKFSGVKYARQKTKWEAWSGFNAICRFLYLNAGSVQFCYADSV